MSDWQQQYAEIATLAGGLAHEIRNPLSTIRLNVDLVVEELEDSEEQRDRRLLAKLDRVRRECRHLESILGAFLQFARLGRVEAEPTDLSAFVDQYLDDFQAEAAEHGIDLSPHLDKALPPVAVDPALFRQVLANLCRNARQAMPKGGTLEVATRQEGVTIDGQPGVALEVIDTGCGMTGEQLDRMWEAFYSTKAGGSSPDAGSGLGLPTVRKIIEAHGGRIECESAVGQGTRFRITLPVAG